MSFNVRGDNESSRINFLDSLETRYESYLEQVTHLQIRELPESTRIYHILDSTVLTSRNPSYKAVVIEAQNTSKAIAAKNLLEEITGDKLE